MQLIKRLIVHPCGHNPQKGWLVCGQNRFQCALGKSGTGIKSREGDGLTPSGRWPLRRIFYRADRLMRPRSRLPLQRMGKEDGWCDDPGDKNYNQLVQLPRRRSHESMWREDHLYDLCLVIGFNDAPVRPNRGSAIFMHLARPGYKPTEGCIALSQQDMLTVLARCDLQTEIEIRPAVG